MKKIIGYIGSYGLFWMGQIVSIVMLQTGLFYTQYNWLMSKSSDIQDWAGLDRPWKKC